MARPGVRGSLTFPVPGEKLRRNWSHDVLLADLSRGAAFSRPRGRVVGRLREGARSATKLLVSTFLPCTLW